MARKKNPVSQTRGILYGLARLLGDVPADLRMIRRHKKARPGINPALLSKEVGPLY